MNVPQYNMEELLQTLFEETGDALFLFDPDDEQIIDANPMAQRLSGFSRKDLLSRPITYLFRSEEQGGLERLRRAYKKTGLFHSQEGFLLRNRLEGIWVPVNLSISRLHAEPKTLGLINARDITERRQTQAALEVLEHRLRTVIDNAPVVLFAMDAAGAFTFAAGKGLEAMSLKPGQGVGRSVFDVYRDAPRFLEQVRRALAGETFTAELEIETGPGKGRWFETHYTPLYDRRGRPEGAIGIATDITEHKRTAAALSASEERYRELFENANDIVYTHDLNGNFTSINKAGQRGTRYTPEEFTRINIAQLVAPEHVEQARRQVARKATGETQQTTYELDIVAKDGRRIPLEVSTRLIYDGGKPVAVQGIARDVTERKNLEAQLRQAQKMEAVGQLAGGIAHDFNNLLSVILGNNSLLLAALPADEPNHELAATVEKAAMRAAELTRQMLGFSRRSVLQLESTNLNMAVKEAETILRHSLGSRIVVEIDCTADLWTVQADPGHVSQVLMNLCINARDAMPDGGRLLLQTENVVLDEAYAATHLEGRVGEFVRLRVSDTGHGMPPEVRQRIFEPFFTTKEPGKGTGLGLSVVFGIVNQHKGWIDCDSELGRGTRFDVYLPRDHSLSAALAPAVKKAPGGGKETILLVDDEAMLRNLGSTILKRFGYQVLLAEDGVQALEIYRKEHEHISLVILDQTMPRLSGYDTLQQLFRIDPKVRVMLSSGLPAEQVLRPDRGHALGFIPKPYSPADLAEKVRSALDEGIV